MKRKKYSKNNIGYTQKTVNKQESRKKPGLFIIAGIVILLMVLSVVSYSLISDEDTEEEGDSEEYNGYEFREYNGNWVSVIAGQQIAFQNHPKNLENTNFGPEELALKDKVYIAYNNTEIKENDQDIQRVRSLMQTLRGTVYLACSTEENCGDLPVKNCKDDNTIIQVKTAKNLKIYKEDSCIVIESSQSERNKAIEALYYKITGVIK
mgnify:CR=1 FL=1